MDADNGKNPTSIPSTDPIVTMKPLMFYKVCSVIANPTKLKPKNSAEHKKIKMGFMASQQEFDDILRTSEVPLDNKTLQIQLRFCVWRHRYPQVDHLPRHLKVKVNRKKCFVLKEKESNQRPINITNLVRLSDVEHNVIKATWSLTDRRDYAMSVYWVKKLTTADLLKELWAKKFFSADNTRTLIQEKLAACSGKTMTNSLRVSLICPLGQSLMAVPCRSLFCFHLEIFDAVQYLKRNKEKETWRCPICVKKANFRNLVIDEYFLDILNSRPRCREIELLPDGSWSPVGPRRDSKDGCDGPGLSGLQALPLDSDKENLNTAAVDGSQPAVKLPYPAATPTIRLTRPQQPPTLIWDPLQDKPFQQSRSPLSSLQPTSTSGLNLPSNYNFVKEPCDQSFSTSQPGSDYSHHLPWYPTEPMPTSAPAPNLGPALGPAPSPVPAPAPGPYPGWLPTPLPTGIYGPSSQQPSPCGLGAEQERDLPALEQLVRYQPPAPDTFPTMDQVSLPARPMGNTEEGLQGWDGFSPIPPTMHLAPAHLGTGAFSTQASRASPSRVIEAPSSRTSETSCARANEDSSSRIHKASLSRASEVLSPQESEALSSRVRRTRSSRVNEASASRVSKALSSRVREASSSSTGKALSSGERGPSFSRMSKVSTSKVKEVSSSRMTKASCSRAREASFSRTSKAPISKVSEASSSGVSKALPSRTRKASTSKVEASSSRMSKASSSKVSEALSSRTSEAPSSRMSKALSARMSKTSSSKVSEASSSRANKASSSRANKAPSSRASEASSSRMSKASSSRINKASSSRVSKALSSRASDVSSSKANSGQSFQVGGAASILDNSESKDQSCP
ncbi:E3 SUMO-protein ligase PIAS3-like [Ornithorhynchus anatinus]|uniref:SP-RING-type domain-containing protein n=1 Tax=Ornithorhynchus anatinus TaxID=9258 RepID=A0A6I8PF85_ORNAN|nr:E3 SUMO-protein ligase PIAS3-like [Ornithorhynchus anatinus]